MVLDVTNQQPTTLNALASLVMKQLQKLVKGRNISKNQAAIRPSNLPNQKTTDAAANESCT